MVAMTREQKRAKARERYATDPEYRRKVIDDSKVRAKRDPERHNKKCYEWRQANLDRRRAKLKEWRKVNPDKAKDAKLKLKYGITLAARNAMLAGQGNSCAICRSEHPRSKVGWNTDHDHKTGSVRGILCQPCNHLLGNARDDSSILEAAIHYLELARIIG